MAVKLAGCMDATGRFDCDGKNMDDKSKLSNLQLVALATAIKNAAFNVARGEIAEGSSHDVDFRVRVTGCVQRSTGTPGGPYSTPASVQLSTLPVFCAVLAKCGIGVDRLRKALESIDPSAVQVDAKRSNVFDEVAQAKAKLLPPVSGFYAGKSGVLQTTIAVELLK